MKKIKQGIRLLALVLILMMASVGLGLGGGIMPGYRRKYEDLPVTTELVEHKDEGETQESASEKT